MPSLVGGGGDGGSTGAEDRAAYLAMYAGKKHDKVDPAEQKLAQYTMCHLSGAPLHPPCVADALGNLYNKDAVLTALVTKNVPKGLPHINSRKRVFDVKLYPFAEDNKEIKYGCPVTGLPLNGKYKFVLVKDTSGKGHVISEKAVKEMDVVVSETVGATWSREEIIAVYPVGEELDRILDKVMASHREELEAKAKKKAKKTSKHARTDEIADGKEDEQHSKKQKEIDRLMPAHADPKIWASLFTSNSKEEKKATNDYMTRGGLKYI